MVKKIESTIFNLKATGYANVLYSSVLRMIHCRNEHKTGSDACL